MTTLDIYITQSDYKTHFDTIDQYTISNESIAVMNSVYIKLKITVSNLCELWNKLGPTFRPETTLNKPRIVRINNLHRSIYFLFYVLDNVDDSEQLIQTISNLYKDDVNDKCYDLFCYSLKAKDPNAWLCFPLENNDRFICIKRLFTMFETAEDDSYVDVVIAHVKLLDIIFGKDNSPLK